jgi:type IV fimbrial biogenesis protein FimT
LNQPQSESRFISLEAKGIALVMKSSRNDGFSLVEILVALSIIAIGLTLSVPSWKEARSKRELVSASENFSTFLSVGRSLAVKHNKEVAVSLRYQDSITWCVGLADSVSACDCTVEDADQNNFCAVGGVPQILHANDLSRTELVSYAADTSFAFDGVRGILVPTDLERPHFFNLMSTNGKYGLQVGISATGNTIICNWLDSANVPSYRSCETVFEEPVSPTFDSGLQLN